MKWVRYQDKADGRNHFGSLDADSGRITEIEGDLFGARKPTGRTHQLDSVRLLPPIMPLTFYAAGINYPNHVRTAAAKKGADFKLPTQCDIGYRANNALVAHGDAIVIPSDSEGKVQFEGELVVIIGKQVKHLTEENAMSCIFGYTIGNDVSERKWQAADRTFWRGKNADTFKPMGPWIETDLDVDTLSTVVRLNGKEVSRFPTNSMIFKIPTVLATMTRYLTLYPGDVVWMGTEDPTLDMVAGDTVEVEINGLGVLRNPVVTGR